MTKIVNKTVKLTLVGLNGNTFNLMGAFRKAARRQGWTENEINKVLDECKSGDYDHLLVTLMNHCEDGDGNEEDADA